MEKEFRKDTNQTREEFLSQFSKESEEITAMVFWSWEKGRGRFDRIGDENLIYVECSMPWAAEGQNITGRGRYVYWLGKKRFPLGYPYPPHLKAHRYYRLKVRKCLFDDRYFYLEEVLEKNVNVAENDEVYTFFLKNYLDKCSEETKEVTVCCAEDLDISKSNRLKERALWFDSLAYSAILEENGRMRPAAGSITVPFDERHFSRNKTLKFKAGRNYKLKVTERSDAAGSLALVQVLEENVIDEELSELGSEALKPVKWPVEGFDDFEIRWNKYQAQASCEYVLWPDPRGNDEISVYLECDEENCMTAHKTTKEFLKFYHDWDALRKKIFQAVADDMADEDGKIVIWDESETELSKNAFMKRLSLSYLSFGAESVEITIDLDEMFTDHDYTLTMDYDGTIHTGGLIG